MSELREALMAIYAGRRDVYAEQLTRTRLNDAGEPERGATWRLVESALTDTILDQHLAGKRTVGVYLHHPDSMVRYVVWDIDTLDRSPVRLIFQALDACEIDALLFESGHKGYHVVTAFDTPMPGYLAFSLVRAMWEKAGRPEHVDLFPRQDAITPDRPYGNQVKLPLGIHRGTGQRCRLLTRDFFPVAEGTETDELLGLRRITRAELESSLDAVPNAPTPNGQRISAATSSGYVHVPYPCFADLSAAQYRDGQRDTLLFTFTKHLHVQQLPRPLIELAVSAQAARCLDRDGRRPMPFEEWPAKVAQVLEHGYTSLGCEDPAMAQFCKGAVCPIWQRSHDAGPEPIDPDMPLDDIPDELTLDDVRQFGVNDPQYAVQVCGREIRVSLEQFASWRRFRTAVMGELRQIPSLPKIPKETPQETWERMVNLALKTSVLEDEPGDADSNADIAQEALIYLRDHVDVSESRENLLKGAAWEQPDEEGTLWRYFMGRFVVSSLRGRVGPVTRRQLYRALHPHGVRGVTMWVEKRSVYVWRIKAGDLETAKF